MDLVTFNREIKQGKRDTNQASENAPGYLVEYPDGYKSWSPKHVFEDAYREISPSELKLIES